jgi:hypothetical protein
MDESGGPFEASFLLKRQNCVISWQKGPIPGLDILMIIPLIRGYVLTRKSFSADQF